MDRLLLALCLLLFPAMADAAPPELPQLPDDTRIVWVDWSDRIWTMSADPRESKTVEQAKADIKDQWDEDQPLMTHARPTLFERKGDRVWFVVGGNETLLGYDGKTWIQHQSHSARGFVGHAENHGRLFWAEQNRDTGTHQFFLDGHGVHVFDGEAWDYQRFEPDESLDETIWRKPQVLVSADRKHVVAISNHPEAVWQFKDGKWERHIWSSTESNPITSAAILPGGELWMQRGVGRIQVVPLVTEQPGEAADNEEPEQLAAQVTDLVDQLASASFAEREAASEGLRNLGSDAHPAIKEALKTTKDPEVKHRLKDVLSNPRRSDTTSRPRQFGEYMVSDVFGLHQDHAGRIYVGAQHVNDSEAPAILMMQPDGSVMRIPALAHPLFSEYTAVVGNDGHFLVGTAKAPYAMKIERKEKINISLKELAAAYRSPRAMTSNGIGFIMPHDPLNSSTTPKVHVVRVHDAMPDDAR